MWLGLLAFLGVVNLYITFIGGGLETDPRAVLFSWPVIAADGLLGLVGIWLSHRTGFPAAWDARITGVQRVVIPALLGVALGVIQAGLDAVFHWTAFSVQAGGLPSFNAPFPGSVLFYPGGAILVEVVYRLLPVPLLLWLISNVLLRGRAQPYVFWILAVLTSLIEPASQDLEGFQFVRRVRRARRFGVRARFLPESGAGGDVPQLRPAGRDRRPGRLLPGLARRLRQLHLPLLS